MLWCIYDGFGGAISQRSDTDTAGYDALESLIPEIQQMRPEEQLQVMRDSVAGADTPITRSYSQKGSSDQMAFWYRLAQGMDNKTVIQVPSDYQLSSETQEFLKVIQAVDFSDKVVCMRNVVSKMGIPPSK